MSTSTPRPPTPSGLPDRPGRDPRSLLVDVLNVVGSTPDGWWRDRVGACARLVDALTDLAARTDWAVTAVVDGEPDPRLPDGWRDGVEVVHAGRARDAADDRIVELLRSRGSGACVVTADRDLRRRVRDLGADTVGPSTLRAWLDEPGPDRPVADHRAGHHRPAHHRAADRSPRDPRPTAPGAAGTATDGGDTVVFLHAHPDDEAIFTGGTIARLVDAGTRVVVIMATGGERGVPGDATEALADHRRAETRAACDLLGVHRLEFLGYTDSGLTPPGEVPDETAFALVDVDEAAARVAGILDEEDAAALVLYDEGGIYGHADHLAVHRVGRRAAELAGVVPVYEATVDREYLHFVATHLVELAALAMHHDVPTGVATVFLTTTVDVRDVLDRKRLAMAAHASQIPPDSEAMHLDPETFAGVYGFEWYVRTGPRGVLDDLAM